MSFETIELFSKGVSILPDGRMSVGERRMNGDVDGWTVATFHVETDAEVHSDMWEMHPSGEELVSVLSGSARIYLRPETVDGAADFVRLTAGNAVVVPRGRWHRIELDEPSDLMSIGPRRGTRLEHR